MNTGTTDWQGLPYFPISQFYKERFGERVRKISVSVAETCPNREGLRGMKTCNFCDAWGSAAHPEKSDLDVAEQIRQVRDLMRQHYPAKKFLVYFQAYTTTFAKTAELRRQFEIAFSFTDVIGAVVGTRPDCISDAVLDLWREYSERYYLSVEMGVQSFSEEQLIWMRRGHTAKRSIDAIHWIKRVVPKVDLSIHLMFGLPGESEQDVLAAAEQCNQLPIDSVKLHNLHVLRNTPLADDYAAGLFQPVGKEAYFHRCKLFLQHLDPRIAVHRLAALSNKPGELVAPVWTSYKMRTYQEFLSYMREQKAHQGQLWVPATNSQVLPL
ncbi:MAG: TIGR01212 family radical SAM protein [Bdellovibrionales bacterium]